MRQSMKIRYIDDLDIVSGSPQDCLRISARDSSNKKFPRLEKNSPHRMSLSSLTPKELSLRMAAIAKFGI